MTKLRYRSSGRSSAIRLLAFGAFISFSSLASAQQLGATSVISGQSIPTQVAVEYATIGGMALPIQILGLDRAGTVGTGGQTASNQQVGNRNTTVISQSGGSTNSASIQVFGDDNQARISQAGRSNFGQGVLTGTEIQFDLRQIGNNNQADLSVNTANTQSGAGVAVLQRGDNNSVTGSVPGGVNVTVNQFGGATADVTQAGVAKSITVQQFRTR